MTKNNELVLVAISLVMLVAGWLTHLAGGPEALRLVLLSISAISASTRTFPEAIHILKSLRLDVDVLMFAAAIGAGTLGAYEEGAFLLFLFGAGSAGESLAMGKARSAIESLTRLAPDTVIKLDDDNRETLVKVDEIRAGDRVLIRPYDRIAVDSVIIQGGSAIDQSSITGESIPIEKSPDDEIFSGTQNGEGRLIVKVLRAAGESTLARIIKLVAEAQSQKSRTQLFTDKIESIYVPIVFVITLMLLTLPPLIGFQPQKFPDSIWRGWFYQAMAFLTAASPCALAIGTPAAVLCGIAKSAKIGVLIKGGAHLEALAAIKAIAMDKTGTLTTGHPTVNQIVTIESFDPDRALAIAASIEQHGNHPLGAAIVAAARSRKLQLPQADEVSQQAGLGMDAVIAGERYSVGKSSVAGPIEAWPTQMQEAYRAIVASGQALVAVSKNSQVIALLGLIDQPRESARSAISRFQENGVEEIAMLTGDHAMAAQMIAKNLGLGTVHADLHPEQKLDIIEKMSQRHGAVAMIGDGVNDAPALAKAHIGIAIGAAGTQVAMETADVVLMGNDLTRLADAMMLARRAKRIITQNMVIALGVICVVAPLSALGFTSLGIAVLLHEGSTIVVVLNGLRLLR